MSIENLILSTLISNEEYTKLVIPFLQPEYFTNDTEKILFNLVKEHFIKYKALPTKEALTIEIDSLSLQQKQFDSLTDYIDKNLEREENTNLQYTVDKTESFCKERAMYLALKKALDIADDNSNKEDKGAIPKILQDALAVSFDTKVGHDYLNDVESRYEALHRSVAKLPSDITLLNKITGGGVEKKTLNLVMAGTGVGKSIFLCHHAASYLNDGHKVLYITLELSEEKVAERIDANLLNISIGDIKNLPKQFYLNKVSAIRNKTNGRLIIREYPTASANILHFKTLLQELHLKNNFVPDVIMVDYLNIMTSARLKAGAVNSYQYNKSIAEELRGIAVEFNIPIWTATQVNRGGSSSSDFGLEDTSESFGVPMTADLMIALISTPEFEEANQIMVKQLKNRYGDISYYTKFLVGLDKSKMKFFDIEEDDQQKLSEQGKRDEEEDRPIFDRTKFGKKDKRNFNGFKFDEAQE